MTWWQWLAAWVLASFPIGVLAGRRLKRLSEDFLVEYDAELYETHP